MSTFPNQQQILTDGFSGKFSHNIPLLEGSNWSNHNGNAIIYEHLLLKTVIRSFVITPILSTNLYE